MAEEKRQKILYLRDVMQLSFSQIGERIGMSRKTASRIYRGSYLKRGRPARSALDKYSSLIGNWFTDYPRIKAKQVHAWLKERGVEISYYRVVQFTRDRRKKKEKFFNPLSFLPGEEGQVDWFFVNHHRLGKLSCFVMVLSFSRYLFAYVFPRSSFEFFIEGHLKAFAAFNGIPHGLLYDNLKSVVLSLSPEIRHNPRFMEFSRHYRIDVRLCNPYSANEKGRVERANRTIKENFFNIAADYSSLETLNQGLTAWIKNRNESIHRTTEKRPFDLLGEEKLRPLPAISWNNLTINPPVKTTKTGMMIFDTNYYSVPDYLVGKSLSIYAGVTCIRIYDKDKEVAKHPRSFDRNRQFINPAHRSFSRLSGKAKSQRIYEVIKNLDPAINEFLLKNELCGEDPQKTAYIIFKQMKGLSREMLIGIIRDCLLRKSARIKTFLSCLHWEPEANQENVYPQNQELLSLDYQKRPLEDYENK